MNKRNVTMPADWWSAAETEAARRGIHTAELIRMAIRAKLPREVREQLSEPLGRGRPKHERGNR